MLRGNRTDRDTTRAIRGIMDQKIVCPHCGQIMPCGPSTTVKLPLPVNAAAALPFTFTPAPLNAAAGAIPQMVYTFHMGFF